MDPISLIGAIGSAASKNGQNTAVETGAQQRGLVAVEENGVFGGAAQGQLASSSHDVFSNQSPASLAALGLDSSGNSLAEAFDAAIGGGGSNRIAGLPWYVWLGIAAALITIFHIGRKH